MSQHKRYCPHCGTDLRGERIPQEHIDRGYYSADDPWFYRTIGIYDMGLDMTVEWQCPDCGGRWPR